MYPALTYAVAALLGLLAILALVAIAKPSLDRPARLAMKGLHGATAFVVALDAVMLLQGHEVDNNVTHIGYMVAAVGLPVILLNQRGEVDEKGKPVLDDEGNQVPAPPPHLGVVAVCALAMAVLVVRLQMTL
ncbi:hypothetical protein [Nocardioides gilvus]|uniref:hypothetical protein n=1 Tax=Nocardioides gilvus TaxID=1735589 RepID=UPI0013A5B81A|nr:hypothetical protein [Nocardioides gilvus]